MIDDNALSIESVDPFRIINDIKTTVITELTIRFIQP